MKNPKLFPSLVPVLALLAAVSILLTACSNEYIGYYPSMSPRIPTYTLGFFFGNGAAPATMKGPAQVRVGGSTLWVENPSPGSVLQAWTLGGTLSLSLTSYNSNTLIPNCLAVGPDGYIYAGDNNLKQIVEFTPTGAYVGVFGSTELAGTIPSGVAVDSTRAYLCNYQPSASIYSYSVTGTGSTKAFTSQGVVGPTLNNPQAMSLNPNGFLWIADSGNKRLVELNGNSAFAGAITLVSNGVPTDVALDSHNNIYATDSANVEVQMFDPMGNPVTQFGHSALVAPTGLCFDGSGNLYVADQTANQVVVFNRN